MRSLSLTPLLLASATALPEIALQKRDRHNGGQTSHFRRSVAVHEVQKRQEGTVGTNIFNVLSWSFGGAYYANITVGTPAQEQTVILDTGSSDLYFDSSSADSCQLPEDNPNSCQGGTFDKTKSNTYNEIYQSPAFNASYGDGSTAVGPFGSDVIGIGNILVQPVQFGIAEEVNSTTGFAIGLLGLGYSANEAVPQQYYYPNLPEVLKDAGVINSRLFSVYLNDDRAIQGSILFGGIDKSKYTGDIATVDLIPALYNGESTGPISQFVTTITGASANIGGKDTELWSGGSPGAEAYLRRDSSLPVLLDTGSTAWSMPQSYYANYIQPNFPFVDSNGACSCEHANSGDYLTLEFGGKVSVKLDVSEFIAPLINSTTKEPIPYDSNNDACFFLISPETDAGGRNFGIAGDAVMRSMYAVFDLDNGQVSIAQAAINSTSGPDVVVVKAGANGVANAVSASPVPSNTFDIYAEVTGAVSSFSASTAASTIGTATGEAAVPEDAQIEDDGSSGTGTGSGGGSHSTSKGAAAGIVIPGADYTGFWVASIWVACLAMGVGLMM